MRTKKDFGILESYHYYPEIKVCPHCGCELVRSHSVWSKVIISLIETAKVTNWGYRCAGDSCPATIYRSVLADGFALKGHNFALDIIVFIGQERFNQHRNLNEIHSTLLDKGVQISSRRISDFLMVYELLLSTTQIDKLRARRENIIQQGGVRLAIDGIQPQAGKEILYIFRDAISGERFGAVSLAHHDQKTLAREMRKIAQLLDFLELPLRSIITDHQPGLIEAVAEVWKDVPHQFCQLHFLKTLAKPIARQDSNLASKLKKALRPIKEIERELAEKQESLRQSKSQPDEEQAAMLVAVPEITPPDSPPVSPSSPALRPTLPFSVVPEAKASEILITSPSSLASAGDTTANLAEAPVFAHLRASCSDQQAQLPLMVGDEHLTALPVNSAADLFVQLAEPAHEQYFLADTLLPKTAWQEEVISGCSQPSELSNDHKLAVVKSQKNDDELLQNREQNSLAQEQEKQVNSLSVEQQEKLIQVHLGYTDAIRRLLLLKPLAPFKLTGLQIYEQAIELSDSIARCLDFQSDSTLSSIQDLLAPINLFRPQYLTINRRQQYLLAFADLLEVPKTAHGDWCQTGAEVATTFCEFLSDLPAYAELYPEDSNLLAYFEARSLEWMEGLFYCYDERDSPRTNNSLEQYNHFLKSQRRRVTGQKNVSDYLVRHGPLIIFHDPDESFEQILARFRQASFEEFKDEYERFQQASRRPRNTISYSRDPKKYMTNLEQSFFEIFA